ncbi:hypothetical protein [Candidatus Ruthturnera calyptogenae]|nr:hypothetical protein [Candidatus Ruthturnera calyptogenae]
MVIYAATTEITVNRMFLADVMPRLIIGSMMMIVNYIIAKMKGYPSMF